MPDRLVRWTLVTGVSVALFLGVLGFEIGRAGAGGDPAIPAEATSTPDPVLAAPEPVAPAPGPLTTRQS
jgi:hypothetical protein